MVKEWCTVKVAARIGRRRGSPPRHHRYRERLVDGVHLSKLAFPLNHLESTVDPIERHPSTRRRLERVENVKVGVHFLER